MEGGLADGSDLEDSDSDDTDAAMRTWLQRLGPTADAARARVFGQRTSDAA